MSEAEILREAAMTWPAETIGGAGAFLGPLFSRVVDYAGNVPAAEFARLERDTAAWQTFLLLVAEAEASTTEPGKAR